MKKWFVFIFMLLFALTVFPQDFYKKFENAVNFPEYPLFTNFFKVDGIKGNEFLPGSALKTKNGILYFGGVNGLIYFKPDGIRNNRRDSKLVLTDFKINNKSVQHSVPGSRLSKPITRNNTITLESLQSLITFEFAVLGSIGSSKNNYSYKLEGFDKDWILVHDIRSVTYTNLKPGKYTFRVKSRAQDGYFSDKNSISVPLVIKLPFWRSIGFILFLIIFVLAIFILYYQVRVKSVKGQKLKLKTVVSEKILEFEGTNRILELANQELKRKAEESDKEKEVLCLAIKNLEENQKGLQLRNLELEDLQTDLRNEVELKIFELEEAKMNAEASERLKMAFLSNMSHEIRTPMNAIVGFASLLGDNDLTLDEKEDYIKQINTNGESLLLLIDDILDLSKIESNQLSIRKESFDLKNLIYEIYTFWKQFSLNRGGAIDLTLENQLNAEDFVIESDKQRIKQILYKLLDNAFKFTAHGKITITVYSENSFLHILIKDTGIGITKESLDYIFDRFRKGTDMGTKLYRGAGLGLTISKKLAQLMGGDLIALPSQDEQKGSVFKLSLPLQKIKASRPVEKKIKAQALESIQFTGKKILIVEDEENNYLFLRGVLIKRGCDLSWAKNGQQAVDFVQKNKYHLVLMDIKMPLMNGLDATRLIRDWNKDLVIVAQTAFARPEEESNIRQAGFDDYIAKPIKKEDLILLLNKFIGSI